MHIFLAVQTAVAYSSLWNIVYCTKMVQQQRLQLSRAHLCTEWNLLLISLYFAFPLISSGKFYHKYFSTYVSRQHSVSLQYRVVSLFMLQDMWMSTPDKLGLPVFTAAKCMNSCLRFSLHLQIQWLSPRRTTRTTVHVSNMAPVISRQAKVCCLLS